MAVLPTNLPTKKWLRNGELARYLGISNMCLWRWKRDPALSFPAASVINDIEFNNVDHVDRWMRQRIVKRHGGGR